VQVRRYDVLRAVALPCPVDAALGPCLHGLAIGGVEVAGAGAHHVFDGAVLPFPDLPLDAGRVDPVVDIGVGVAAAH